VGVAENIATARAFYTAGPADDDRDRYGFASPDIVWHVPGDNPVARDYTGVDDVFRVMGETMQPLDEWRIEVVDVFGNRDLVMATVNLVAHRGPHRVESTGGHVFRFDDAGRMVEAWGFVRDQQALDELFRFGT
jgi:uncharacterized protein